MAMDIAGMQGDRTARLVAGVAAVASGLLLLVSAPLYVAAGSPPSLQDAAAFADYIAGHDVVAISTKLVDSVYIVGFIVFVSGFRQLIRTALPRQAWIADLFFGSGLVHASVVQSGMYSEEALPWMRSSSSASRSLGSGPTLARRPIPAAPGWRVPERRNGQRPLQALSRAPLCVAGGTGGGRVPAEHVPEDHGHDDAERSDDGRDFVEGQAIDIGLKLLFGGPAEPHFADQKPRNEVRSRCNQPNPAHRRSADDQVSDHPEHERHACKDGQPRDPQIPAHKANLLPKRCAFAPRASRYGRGRRRPDRRDVEDDHGDLDRRVHHNSSRGTFGLWLHARAQLHGRVGPEVPSERLLCAPGGGPGPGRCGCSAWECPPDCPGGCPSQDAWPASCPWPSP